MKVEELLYKGRGGMVSLILKIKKTCTQLESRHAVFWVQVWHSSFYTRLPSCPSLLFSQMPYPLIIFEWVSEVAQSCPTLCNPMDCSLPGSFVHGIFQARILEWVAISFSRRSSQPRDQTQVLQIVVRLFSVWATREVQANPKRAETRTFLGSC